STRPVSASYVLREAVSQSTVGPLRIANVNSLGLVTREVVGPGAVGDLEHPGLLDEIGRRSVRFQPEVNHDPVTRPQADAPEGTPDGLAAGGQPDRVVHLP